MLFCAAAVSEPRAAATCSNQAGSVSENLTVYSNQAGSVSENLTVFLQRSCQSTFLLAIDDMMSQNSSCFSCLALVHA